MSKDFLEDRRHALEEAFFAKHNEALLRRLREADATASWRQKIAAASGITDDAVLDRPMDLGIGSETVAALSMVPLVVAAWADGNIDERERTAILSGATEAGIDKDGPSYEMLGQWLRQPPRSWRPGPPTSGLPRIRWTLRPGGRSGTPCSAGCDGWPG